MNNYCDGCGKKIKFYCSECGRELKGKINYVDSVKLGLRIEIQECLPCSDKKVIEAERQTRKNLLETLKL